MGTPIFSLISRKTASPFVSPGPRKDWPELRLKLCGEKPGMMLELHNFHQAAVRREPAEHQPVLGQLLPIGVIELVAVAMALLDLRATVGLIRPRAFFQHAGVCPQTHGTA